MRRNAAVLGLVALLLSGCGRATTGAGRDQGPPPYLLAYDGAQTVLAPYGWCYGTACIDGTLAEHPLDVGSPAEIRVRVPLDGWDLAVRFTAADRASGGGRPVTPRREGDWYVLRPALPAGVYLVDLFSRGEGDMAARFRWERR